MFKNAVIYKTTSPIPQLGELLEALGRARFVECGATQQASSGWVPARGVEHGALAESIGGQLIFKLMTETKSVPAEALKRRVEEVAVHIHNTTGRRPGKKQTKEIKEEVLLELLPQAFAKRSAALVWIDPASGYILVDASSQGRADEVASFLVKTLQDVAISQLHTELSPAAAMSEWLVSGEPPLAFTVDRDCELKSSDEMKSVVRYNRHSLDIDEVREHITSGKVPTKLGMSWEGRVSFLLTDTMQVKKLSFLDVVFEGQKAVQGKDEAFDADAAIATGELTQLIRDLVSALGGEPKVAE